MKWKYFQIIIKYFDIMAYFRNIFYFIYSRIDKTLKLECIVSSIYVFVYYRNIGNIERIFLNYEYSNLKFWWCLKTFFLLSPL